MYELKLIMLALYWNELCIQDWILHTHTHTQQHKYLICVYVYISRYLKTQANATDIPLISSKKPKDINSHQYINELIHSGYLLLCPLPESPAWPVCPYKCLCTTMPSSPLYLSP